MRIERKCNFSEDGQVCGYNWYDDKLSQYRGIVILVHGMAEHIERYDEFANLLADNGFFVYGNNQRGHKDTSTKENYGYMSDIDCLQILVNDVHETQELAMKEHPNLPVYIFSHSMGSFVTQRYIELYGNTLKGCILCGSAKQPRGLVNLGGFLAKVICAFKGRHHRSKFFDNLTFGSYNKEFKPNRTEYDWLNRNEEEVDKYIADEYCGGIFTIAYYKDFMKMIKVTLKNYNKVPKDLPILIVSGSKDPVGACSKNVEKLYEEYKKQGIKDIEMILYPEARHELILENCKEDVKKDCLSFLLKH